MLGNVAVVKILYAEVVDDLQEVGKIEQGKVKPVIAGWYRILNRSVNAKNVKWLDQQVDTQQE